MNICLLNDSFPPVIDGVSNTVLNYAEIISQDLGNCVVATPDYPGVTDDYEFPVYRYRSLNTTKLVGYRAGWPFEASTILNIASGKPDLIHSHCPVSSTMLARALRDATGAPAVMTYHTKFDIDIRNAVRSNLLQEAAIRFLVNNIEACDEVWTVSHGAGKNLESLGYSGTWRVMENGVDLPKERADEATVRRTVSEYDLPAGVPVFLFVGRLMWYKGIRLITDGLASYGADGRDYRVVFVGNGMEEQEIRDYVSSCGIGDRAIFTGAVRDREALRGWYTYADLLLFPSTFDTNGLVVREAAACGLPSLLIEGSCAAEGVEDGHNGFLIREDAEDLAELLRTLTREKCREVGETAQTELYMSWEDSVRRAWDRYAEIVDEWRSGRMKKRVLTPAEDLTDMALQIRGALEKVREKIGDSSPHPIFGHRSGKRSKR